MTSIPGLVDREQAAPRTGSHARADAFFRWLTLAAAALVVVIMAGIFFQLVRDSAPSLKAFGARFLITDSWNPVTGKFGALSSIYGTLVSTAIAMLIAFPLSLVSAIFLVELAPPRVSRFVGYGIELLAAVPSIIFGMWGLFVFAPYLADHVQPALQHVLGFLPLFKGPPMGIGMLPAGIILALMVLPFTTAVMRDVLRMVPPMVNEAAYGMGATTLEVVRKVTVPYAVQGVLGATFLGLGRAIGETMAITFVIGNDHGVNASLYAAGNSIASTLANEFTEASDPLYLSSLIELGLVLFVMTLGVQVVAHLWLRRVKRSMGGGL
jgi:phosphate transport system permease protein